MAWRRVGLAVVGGMISAGVAWTAPARAVSAQGDASAEAAEAGSPSEAAPEIRHESSGQPVDAGASADADADAATTVATADVDAAAQAQSAAPANAPATPSDAPARPPREPAAAPAQPAVPPSRALVGRGAWLISVDEALPLLAVGSATPLSTRNALRVGDPGGFVLPSPPRHVFVDYVAFGGLTLGAAPIAESTITESAKGDIDVLGYAFRAGYTLALGERFVLWPRAGVMHVDDGSEDAAVVHRTDLVVDARLAWTLDGRWAVTVGPSLSHPISAGRPSEHLLSGSLPQWREPDARIALSAGLTLRLDAAPGPVRATTHDDVRVLVGVERVLPLLRLRGEQTGAASSQATDLGLTDVTDRFPVRPRMGLDVVVGRSLTLGAAASFGYVRTSSTRFVPGDGPEAVTLGLAPRIGGLFWASRRLAIWPRAGVSWVRAVGSRPDLVVISAYHVGVEVDAFAAVFPIEGVGLTLGPTVSIPLASGGPVVHRPRPPFPGVDSGSTSEEDYSLFMIGVSGGLLVTL